MNTKIAYFYRDGEICKIHNQVVLPGVPTGFESDPEGSSLRFQKAVSACLTADSGCERFLPQYVGLPAERLDWFDADFDHDLFEFESVEPTPEAITEGFEDYPVAHFLADMEIASRSGWRAALPSSDQLKPLVQGVIPVAKPGGCGIGVVDQSFGVTRVGVHVPTGSECFFEGRKVDEGLAKTMEIGPTDKVVVRFGESSGEFAILGKISDFQHRFPKAVPMPESLMVCTMPGGIVYCDKSVEEDGDYKQIGFLSYATLDLEVSDSIEPALHEAIESHAGVIQEHPEGAILVSSVGQAVHLGTQGESRTAKVRV